MNNTTDQPNLNQGIAQMIGSLFNSMTFKMGVAGILALLLLIPLAMIQDVIHDRSQYRQSVENEVAQKWGGEQVLAGPVLSIPFTFSLENEKLIHRTMHVLPADLNVAVSVEPEILRRGIFEVAVYKAQISVEGSFDGLDLPNAEENRTYHWNRAYLSAGFSDPANITGNVDMNWKGGLSRMKASQWGVDEALSSIRIPLDLGKDGVNASGEFAFTVPVRGSKAIKVVPMGKNSQISMESSWPHPSFTGNRFPDSRDIGDNGFSATWNLKEYNRQLPEVWSGAVFPDHMKEMAVGSQLYIPADDYQKATRATKYGFLVVALTFMVFLIGEVLSGRNIHVIQYLLVGLALVLFYAILVSVTEHLSFNSAYAIAAVTVLALVSYYSRFVFRNLRIPLMLSGILAGVYGFIMVILQSQDYALLMGSVGLTVILALIMHFTRNIDWNSISGVKPESQPA